MSKDINKKSNKNKSFIKGIIAGILISIFTNSVVINSFSIYKKFVLGELEPLQKVEQIQSIIDAVYVNDYDIDAMNEAMYKSIVYSLEDPYSYYMTPTEFTSFMEQTEGNYVGIGIMVNINADEEVVINTVFDNSPASGAELMSGDIIVAVSGVSASLENYEEIISLIKGKEGTAVTIDFFRPDDNLKFSKDIIRKSIDVPTIYYELLDDNIAYIKITQFDRVTYSQFVDAFNELQSAKGLIIDLRDNPGGLLDVVNNITDLLIPEGIITYIEDNSNKRDYHYSDASYYNKPLAILVNENSASASEVLSGAVKDFEVGTLIGNTTYGKGVVQNVYTLPDDSAVKVTIAKYYTPNGICIDGTGIEPDIKILNDDENYPDEDLQLQKAIEVINASN